MAQALRPEFPNRPAVAWRDLPTLARALFVLAPLRRPRLKSTALTAVLENEAGIKPTVELFRTGDGGHLAFRRYPSPGQTELVLLHGAACYGAQFHFFASRMAELGIATVHVLDLRGHGMTRGYASAGVTDPGQWSADVANYVVALAKARPGARIVMGGHSAGGGLAISLAEGPAAAHIAAWLLFAPFLGYASKALRPYFGGWLQSISRGKIIVMALANLLGTARFNAIRVAQFADKPTRDDIRFVHDWSFAAMLGFGCGAATPRIAADRPVLLVVGTADECFRADRYPADLARIAPHGQVMQIGNAGHWDILGHPQAIDDAAQWLESGRGDQGNFDEIRRRNVA